MHNVSVKVDRLLRRLKNVISVRQSDRPVDENRKCMYIHDITVIQTG